MMTVELKGVRVSVSTSSPNSGVFVLVSDASRPSPNLVDFTDGSDSLTRSRRRSSRMSLLGPYTQPRPARTPLARHGIRSSTAGYWSQVSEPAGTNESVQPVRACCQPGSESWRCARRSNFSPRVPLTSMYRISAGTSASVSGRRRNIAMATGVSMLNTAFLLGGCLPSGVTLMIHPCEQVDRKYCRIPRNPGPERYPVAVMKQTTPLPPSRTSG